MANNVKIKKGDTVKVIAGAHKGKSGKVLEVMPAEGRVRIEGIAMVKRHLAPQKNPRHPEGGIVEGAGSVHVSNVMLVSTEHGRPVRTGASFTDDNAKMRVARGRNVKALKV